MAKTKKQKYVIPAYESADRLLTMLTSAYGEKIREKHPGLIALATKIRDGYKAAYLDSKLLATTDAVTIMDEITEAVRAKEIIPQDSLDSIKAIDELITKEGERLQSLLLFDPALFYDKYVLALTSPNLPTVAPDPKATERFSIWFKGSQVVTTTGEPLIVYHGSGGLKQEFDQFKFSPFPAVYFAENKSYSEWFANEIKKGGKKVLFQVYLRVLNPIDLTPFNLDLVTYDDFVDYIKYKYGYDLPENKMLRTISEQKKGMWAWRYLRGGVDWLKHIKKGGEFDGFSYFENNPDDKIKGKENVTKAWMVFSGHQIKSADIRNTTFSLYSDSIKMEKGGVVC